jgi:hypothetical protein
MNAKIKPEISTQLDRIWEHTAWNHLDVSKGTWPVMERQGAPLVGIHCGLMGGQSIGIALNTRACRGSDGEEGAEDDDIDDENVEIWELEDDEDVEATRATMMILDIMTMLRGTQLEPIRTYSREYRGALLHLHSDSSLNSCSSCVLCSVLNLFSTGNQVLRYLQCG